MLKEKLSLVEPSLLDQHAMQQHAVPAHVLRENLSKQNLATASNNSPALEKEKEEPPKRMTGSISFKELKNQREASESFPNSKQYEKNSFNMHPLQGGPENKSPVRLSKKAEDSNLIFDKEIGDIFTTGDVINATHDHLKRSMTMGEKYKPVNDENGVNLV